MFVPKIKVVIITILELWRSNLELSVPKLYKLCDIFKLFSFKKILVKTYNHKKIMELIELTPGQKVL